MGDCGSDNINIKTVQKLEAVLKCERLNFQQIMEEKMRLIEEKDKQVCHELTKTL